MSGKHLPSSWAAAAAAAKFKRGTKRAPAASHRRTDDRQPVRQTTQQASRAIAKELRRNSRKEEP